MNMDKKAITLFIIIGFVLLFAAGTRAEAAAKTLAADRITLSKVKLPYNGKARKTAVTVRSGRTVLEKGKSYKLYYKNNIKVGTAKVIVRGAGRYTGRVVKTFSIVPASRQISSVKAEEASLTVRWPRAKSQTTGYQLQLSTGKSFKKNVASVYKKQKTSGSSTGVALTEGLPEKTHWS